MLSAEANNAVTVLRNGGIAILPTETVYALSANAYDDGAVSKVFEYKRRDRTKALPIAYRSFDRALRDVYCDEISSQLAQKFLPGPLTLVLPLRQNSALAPSLRAGLPTVAIRVPNHDLLHIILDQLDFPVIITSANQSREGSTTSAQRALASLGLHSGEEVAVVDGGECKIGRESTIVAVKKGEICVLREGAISRQELQGVGPGH